MASFNANFRPKSLDDKICLAAIHQCPEISALSREMSLAVDHYRAEISKISIKTIGRSMNLTFGLEQFVVLSCLQSSPII